MWTNFWRGVNGTKDFDLFKPTQTTDRKHRFLPLTREKSKGMEGTAFSWTFRGARYSKMPYFQSITYSKGH